ncbi:hypothetical protein ACLOJK_023927 [Asimina triloba]
MYTTKGTPSEHLLWCSIAMIKDGSPTDFRWDTDWIIRSMQNNGDDKFYQISMADQSRGRRDQRAASDDSNVRSETQSPVTVRWRIISDQKNGDDASIKNPLLPH